MTSRYQSLHSIQARLIGFAQAVRDLHELGYPMSQEAMTKALIEYATEYEMTRNMINEHSN